VRRGGGGRGEGGGGRDLLDGCIFSTTLDPRLEIIEKVLRQGLHGTTFKVIKEAIMLWKAEFNMLLC
jgi:hypothetical protein